MAKKTEKLAVENGEGLRELEHMCDEWWCFALLGASLVVLGMVAIATPLLMTIVTAKLFGFVLLVGGIAQLISAFWAGRWSGVFVQMLTGVLYVVVGALAISDPELTIRGLTLLLAVFFLVEGLLKILVALQERHTYWGWTLVSGFVSLFLGLLVWSAFRNGVYWILGILVGVELIVNGWTWIMMGFGLRGLADELAEA